MKLDQKALEAAELAAQSHLWPDLPGGMMADAIAAYLTASKQEDEELRRYIDRCKEMSQDGEFSWWGRLAEILASLSAQVKELTREHRQAMQEMQNAITCAEAAEASLAEARAETVRVRQSWSDFADNVRQKELAERDRIIAEKDKALDDVLGQIDDISWSANIGVSHIVEPLRAARDRRAS